MSIAMAARRLEDRIRELCARLLIEQEPKWNRTAKELQSALQEHTIRLRDLAAAVFVGGTPVVDRRKKWERNCGPTQRTLPTLAGEADLQLTIEHMAIGEKLARSLVSRVVMAALQNLNEFLDQLSALGVILFFLDQEM
jgi:hypothetical protein